MSTNPHLGSTFDSFLELEGIKEVVDLKAAVCRIQQIARDIVAENFRDITYDTDIRMQAEAIIEIADKALGVKP